MLSHGQLDFVGITQGLSPFLCSLKRGLSLSYPHEFDEKSDSKQSLTK